MSKKIDVAKVMELCGDKQLCLQDELSPTARKKLNQFLARYLEDKGKEQ